MRSVPSPMLDPAILSGTVAPSSQLAYGYALKAYVAFVGDSDAALDPTNLAKWRTYRAQNSPLTASSINRDLCGIKKLVLEAAVQGIIDHEIAQAFARIAGVSAKALKSHMRTPPTPLTPAAVRRVCDEPDRSRLIGWRDAAFLSVLASSGCRVSEVITLRQGQILSEGGSFFVSILGKNKVSYRTAPLSSESFIALQNWLARRPIESDFVFTGFIGKSGRPTTRAIGRTTAFRLVQQYARLVGLTGISPHSFRKFIGTQLAKKDIRMAQKALGHARIETTARFYVQDSLPGGLTDNLY